MALELLSGIHVGDVRVTGEGTCRGPVRPSTRAWSRGHLEMADVVAPASTCQYVRTVDAVTADGRCRRLVQRGRCCASGRWTEIEQADEHYTETLFRLSSFPTYQGKIASLPSVDRSYFGLPDRGTLYLCPQRLPKFHPDQDELLRGVLDADPDGYVVLLNGRYDTAINLLQERFRRTLGKAADRVLVLPGQSPDDFQRLLSVGDVLLDIHHYSVSLMGYDAFAVGLPVVTLPGSLKVQRYAVGFYRRLGIEDLIATTPEQYIQRAVRIGTDRDFRDAIRRRIAERNHILFDDLEVVREHERFFEYALAEVEKEQQ